MDYRARNVSISYVPQDDTIQCIRGDINKHIHITLAKDAHTSSLRDYYLALADTVWDRMSIRWLRSKQNYYKRDIKRVYYLSLEFYMGRTLGNAILNLGLRESVDKVLVDMGLDLEELEECEPDAGLGNGGLGRLAACFMDSMANLGISATGYGIRYDYGIFEQKLRNGWQYEEPDDWLCFGNPWERVRQEFAFKVQFFGRVEVTDGRHNLKDTETVYAVPYDTPIPGYMCNVCCTLRLWGSKAPKSFDLEIFNTGAYIDAVCQRNVAENVSRVLYPNDNSFEGKELRLKQEFLLCSASCQDIVRRYQLIDENGPARKDFTQLPEKAAIQLNDTHPSMAIPEMMRILVDLKSMDWQKAWDIVTKVFAYTNHTVLPEALERWPVDMLRHMLPRHLEILYKLNYDFLEMVKTRYPNDNERLRRMSMFDDAGYPKINTAHLCIIGSHAVNGVSAIHSEILKQSTFKDFAELWPQKFQNKTNGVTPRRWLKLCNPNLAEFLTAKLGDKWVIDFEQIKELKKFADDEEVLNKIIAIKDENKKKFVNYIFHTMNIHIDPNTLFDIQVKRIHEYKRQLLNILHVITLYNRLKDDPRADVVPRTVMIGGKAAPGYYMAKLIINLINCVADKIDSDTNISKKLQLVFLTNYRVTMAEHIFPAAELSQQISTAGTEASGTGNMKFMMNGALTIGTLDGANVEMSEEAGKDNIFIFGNTFEEVENLKKSNYSPGSFIAHSPELRKAIEQIRDGYFCSEDSNRFKPIADNLVYSDYYLLCADYEKYMNAQATVEAAYKDKKAWARMSLMNIASSAKFSSDRTITQYAQEIWNVPAERFSLPPPVFNPQAADKIDGVRKSLTNGIDSRFPTVNKAYD